MAVNDTLAAWSDTAFTASIVVYSVAIVGYAGEYAFGRQGRVARTSAAQTGPAPSGPSKGRRTASTWRPGWAGSAWPVRRWAR